MAKVARYSAERIANRVKALGRQISRQAMGRRLDIVVTMDRSFMFAADLIRFIDVPVVVHFVREDIRDVEQSGHVAPEAFRRLDDYLVPARWDALDASIVRLLGRFEREALAICDAFNEQFTDSGLVGVPHPLKDEIHVRSAGETWFEG